MTEKQQRSLNNYVYDLYKANSSFGTFQKSHTIKVFDGEDGNIYISFFHDYSSDMGNQIAQMFIKIDADGFVEVLNLTRNENELIKFFSKLKKMEF